MNLLNELENDLALAFLVEKKHMEKIDSRDARALIAKVKNALYTISCKNEYNSENLPVEKIKTASSYQKRTNYLYSVGSLVSALSAFY